MKFHRKSAAIVVVDGAPIPIEISVCTPRLLCIRLGREDGPTESFVPPRDWPTTPVDPGGDAPALLATSDLRIVGSEDGSHLEFASASGQSYFKIALACLSAGPRLRLQIEVSGEQHFYGLGQGGLPFDRLGTTRRLWNNHVNHGQGGDIAVPVLLSQLGYGLFFDNASRATIDAGDSNDDIFITYECADDAVDLYLVGGGDLRTALAEISTLLGRSPLPPRWALGYLQSTRHFEDAQELHRLPRLFREKQIPCDALILLSTYGDAAGWNKGVGHVEPNPALIPDLPAFVADLHAQNIRLVTHEYPVMHPDAVDFAEAVETKYVLDGGYPARPAKPFPNTNYLEGQRYIDFSSPVARAWWWARHRPLIDAGVDGWWLDGGEGPLQDEALHGGSALHLHNKYDLLRYAAFADGEARDRPDHRVFLLCRSGGPGMQRFGAACWSGDINNTMQTLEGQVAIGLNMAMSGVPYWGTDIGGYYPTAPKSAELFARWFQFGAFCPIFRPHGRTWRDHLPWGHGAEIDAICRRYIELRYRLLPYTYTLAWQAHVDGLPLMRPLVLNYPADPRTWELGSQFLWGDDLLVAPVTREGATHWPVYLPDGAWYDFWTQDRHEGPKGVTVSAPLDRLPLFVRAGAIIPMGAAVQHAGAAGQDSRNVLIYPDGNSAFDLYEDDGATNSYRRGAAALTSIRCMAGAAQIVCAIDAPRGDESVIPAARSWTLQVFSPTIPSAVHVGDQAALPRIEPSRPGDGWWHDGQNFVFVRIAGQDAPFAVTITR